MAHKNNVIKWDEEKIPFEEGDISGTDRTGKFSMIHKEEMSSRRLLKKSTGLCEEVIPNEIAVYYLLKLEQLIGMELGEDSTKEAAMGGRKREDPNQKVRCNYLFPKKDDAVLKKHILEAAVPASASQDLKKRYERLDAINTLKFRETLFVMRNYGQPDSEGVTGVSLEELLARRGKELLKDKPGFVPREGHVRLSEDVASRPYLLRKGWLSVGEALSIFYLASRKLRFYHAHGIAHYDITTDNTTIYYKPEQTSIRQGFANVTTTVAKVVDADFIDWGLARLIKNIDDKTGVIIIPELNELLNGGRPVMTRASEGYYGGGGSNTDIPMRGAESAGLEMLIGDENGKKTSKVNEKHDLFSLGNLLVRMLTGYHATFLSGDFIRAYIREYELLDDKKKIDSTEKEEKIKKAKERITEGLKLLESWVYFSSGRCEGSENPSHKSHETWKTVHNYAKNHQWSDLKSWLTKIKQGSYKEVLKNKLKSTQVSLSDSVVEQLVNIMFRATSDFAAAGDYPGRYESIDAMLKDLNEIETQQDVRSYLLPITLADPSISESVVAEPDVTDLSRYRLKETGLPSIDTAGVQDAIAAAKSKYSPQKPAEAEPAKKDEGQEENKGGAVTTIPLPIPTSHEGLSKKAKWGLGIGAGLIALAGLGLGGYVAYDHFYGSDATGSAGSTTSVVSKSTPTDKNASVQGKETKKEDAASKTIAELANGAPDKNKDENKNEEEKANINGMYYDAKSGADSSGLFRKALDKAAAFAASTSVGVTLEALMNSTVPKEDVVKKDAEAVSPPTKAEAAGGPNSIPPVPKEEPKKEIPICKLIQRSFSDQHVTDKLEITVDYLSRDCSKQHLSEANILVDAGNDRDNIDVKYDTSSRRITVKPRFVRGMPFKGEASFTVSVNDVNHTYYVNFVNEPVVAVKISEGVKEVNEDESITIPVSQYFKDPDSPKLTYSVKSTGGGMTKDLISAEMSDDGKSIIITTTQKDKFTPEGYKAGDVAVIDLQAFDLNSYATNKIFIVVKPVNDCPRVVGNIEDILYIPAGSKGIFDIRRLFVDPDNEPVAVYLDTSENDLLAIDLDQNKLWSFFIKYKKAPIDHPLKVTIAGVDQNNTNCQMEDGTMADEAVATSYVMVQFHDWEFINIGENYMIKYRILNEYSGGSIGGLIAKKECTGYVTQIGFGKAAKKELESLASNAEDNSRDVKYDVIGFIVLNDGGTGYKSTFSQTPKKKDSGNAGVGLEDTPILGNKEYYEENTKILLEDITLGQNGSQVQGGFICIEVQLYKFNP